MSKSDSANASCGMGYFLGFAGAFVYTWQQAEGFGEHIVGALKAVVWPAFLVYDLFAYVQG